ncbi:MAG: transposase family protein [Cyanobacteriota bacterium]|nr:transposase family protein [Cyanobacteriota bacterium]
MLLVAMLSILSGRGSLVAMERFAQRHRQTLNERLNTDFGHSPSDATFRLQLAQLDVTASESLLLDWMTAQPGVAEEIDSLVYDGQTLRGSIGETDSGAATFIPQVSLDSKSLGVAIAHTTHATGASAKSMLRASRWRLSSLTGSKCRPMRCMGTALFPLPRPARRRLPDRGQIQPPQGVSADQRQARPRPPEPVVHQRRGGGRSYITSLRTSASALRRHIRHRWSIVTSGHWVRDVPLRDVAHRYRGNDGVRILDNSVQIRASLRSLAIHAARLDGIRPPPDLADRRCSR